MYVGTTSRVVLYACIAFMRVLPCITHVLPCIIHVLSKCKLFLLLLSCTFC